MAVATLFSLLDDIASLMNNVTVVATKASAATADATSRTIVLTGDDAVVTAEQVLRIPAERENAVISKIRNGSFINKGLMILPAMAIGAFAPWVMTPLLMAGGAWLCYEGAEKLFHGKAHKSNGSVEDALHEIKTYQEKEDKKIKGALRTDRIMSGEIMAVALNSVMKFDPLSQFLALAGVAVATTLAVYEPVRWLIRADDVGLRWQKQEKLGNPKSVGQRLLDFLPRRMHAFPSLGRVVTLLDEAKSLNDMMSHWQKIKLPFKRVMAPKLLTIAPKAMHVLSYLGAAATFLVGGGLLAHGIPGGESLIHTAGQMALSVPGIGGVLESVVAMAVPTAAGLLAGSVIVAMEKSARTLYRMLNPPAVLKKADVEKSHQPQEQPPVPKSGYVPAVKPVVVKSVIPELDIHFANSAEGSEDKATLPEIPQHRIPDAKRVDHSHHNPL